MRIAGWFRARRVEYARAEGLAAGTGLLTGDLADRYRGRAGSDDPHCPACGRDAAWVDAIDLIERRTHRHCEGCRHRWSEDDAQRV